MSLSLIVADSKRSQRFGGGRQAKRVAVRVLLHNHQWEHKLLPFHSVKYTVSASEALAALAESEAAPDSVLAHCTRRVDSVLATALLHQAHRRASIESTCFRVAPPTFRL
jgi:hypothetical protein